MLLRVSCQTIRRRLAPRALSAALLVTAVLSARLSPAQERAEIDLDAKLAPPRLLEAVTAPYPSEALAQGLEATVVLRLTIDEQGRVTRADVAQPAGRGFDEAAQAAALRFRFAPGMRGGRPIAGLIRYPYRFELPRESQPSAAAPMQPATSPPPAPQSPARASAKEVLEPDRRTPTEVTVVGQVSEGRRLQQSAEAVNVIDTRRAQQQTADLGEVLARAQGIAVRRDGGLGSGSRFSLNGLYDEQVRFFLDGVPLDVAGYPLGVANVPVNFVSRVEVYRGVVPIRFGSDALGGAVNLASDESFRSRAAASYQVGSFGTHRVTLDGRYLHERTGLVLGAAAFVDRSLNNYKVDVELANDFGEVTPVTVKRFHDRYAASGINVQAGFVERPWARKLLLSAYYFGYDNEIQNNLVMTVPYGEPTSSDHVVGTTGRYEGDIGRWLTAELLASYAHRTIGFKDVGTGVYDWLGHRVRERNRPGEIGFMPTDQVTWQNTVFARATVSLKLAAAHVLRMSTSPNFASRTGDQRQALDASARDTLNVKQRSLRLISGLEYEVNAFGERLSNIFLLKDYVYHVDADEPLLDSGFRKRTHDSHTFGIGDSTRYRFTPWLYAKASYEHATRLPNPNEVFGNGLRVVGNVDLEPETSDNFNLGSRFELKDATLGALIFDSNAFLRLTDRQIQELGNDRASSYQNVFETRSMGVENAISWASPRRWLTLLGTLTFQDLRNTSTKGAYKDLSGDRIPNRPYAFGSWSAQLRFRGLPKRSDLVEPFYNGRYVHSFYRGWESQGAPQFKQVIASQTIHDIGISWTVNSAFAQVTNTLEFSNVTAAKLYDNFGVQRPGRALYLKFSGTI